MVREYKDSGITWIGRIPQDWNTTKLGSLYTQRNEKVSDKDYAPLSVTMQGILPQLETAAKTDDGDNRKLVKKGDFAINSRSDRRGSCGISPYDGSVSLINTILKPRGEMNPNFYNWLFHTSPFADEFYKWGHGIVDDLWTTRWQEMKNISFVLPTLCEQQKIANYLDTYVPILDKDFVAVAVDKEDKPVGFLFCVPSLSKAVKKANGRLFPFGFIHILRALKKNDTLEALIIGVAPQYQGCGVPLLMFKYLHENCIRRGVDTIILNPQLEENYKVQSLFGDYKTEPFMRRRAYKKSI